VIMYVNPAPAMRLIHSCATTPARDTADTVAVGAMCSCTGFSLHSEPTVASL
jgi:hypothetical protein